MHPFNDLQPTNEGFPWTFRLGALLGGHVPTKSAVNSLLASSRRAVKSSPGGHESAHLQQMLLLGHCSDLLYVSVQRALRALHKWRNRHPYFPNLVNSSFLQCLGRAVCRLGGSVVSPGSFRFGDFTWDTTTPFGFAPNFAHCLRQFWRASLFNRWLGSSRRDAVLARSTGLSSSMSLIDRLRGVAQTIDGHSRQIMAGGLTTEAHSSPIPTDCSCCNQAVVPGTDHILWSCPTFDSYRRYSRPPDELEARLGWGQNGPKQHLIIQTGQIRAVYAEESVRLKKAVKFRQDSAVCIFKLLCNLMYLPCLPTPRPVQPEKTLFHCPLQVWEPWKRLEKKTLDARFMNTALLAVSSDISSALPVWDLPILVDICVSWLSQNTCFL